MDIQIRHVTAREICVTSGPIVIRICDGARTEVEDLIRLTRLFDELLEVHPDIAMLLVFTHGTLAPDSTTQRHAKDAMRRYQDHLVVGVALLGLGFWASAVRAALSAIVRVVGHGSVSIEGSIEQAISRLTMELVGVDGEEVRRVYELAWAELGQAQSPQRTGTDP
jgi:hypothetical protein